MSVYRFALAGILCATLAVMFLRLPHAVAPAAMPAGTPPPAEARPPSVRPSMKWLPESPRYQAARREHFASSREFRAQLDLGTDRRSRQQRYRVQIRQRPEPPALNEFQTWLLHVATSDGRPVSGAVLNVVGGMPQHGHGMPTQPRVQAADTPGDYRVEGLQFSMPGWWEVHVYVSKDRLEDIATFNVLLD